MEEYYGRLDSNADDPAELFEHFEQRTALGRTYHTLPDARHGVERGTVVFPEADVVVRGYPSLPRILVLDPGIPAAFDADDTVVVEEKLNGANVRLASVEGTPVALLRSGYVCPYTTDRARELLDLPSFFDDHPEKVLCTEFLGAESPYTTHDYDDVDTHEFRVFGIRDRESGDPVSVDRRRDLCETYGFPQPRLFGRYDPAAAVTGVRDAIAALDADEREGVVLKTAGGDPVVKYTTESQHHNELAYAFGLPFDHGRDFLFSRVLREAFQAYELDADDQRTRERARDLGESILLPMVETIADVADGKQVGHRHVARGDPDSVDALFDQLRAHGLTIDLVEDRREDGERVVEFLKRSESTQDRIAYYLEGGTRDE